MISTKAILKKLRELGEIARVSPILTSDRGFDPYLEYEIALRLMVNSHPFNEPTECEWLIIGLNPIRYLRNKK